MSFLRSFRRHSLVGPLLCLVLGSVEARAASNKIEFNRDIRPILSDNCFYCHGPDSAARKGDLRLDLRDDAVKSGAIAPHDLSKSKLVERVLTKDADDMMPPPKSNRHLTDAQRGLLQQWIQQGAEYQLLWSFIPPQHQGLPPTTGAGSNNAIDELVSAGLKTRGLALQPEASRETLLRRLSFDLTGLPPSLAELNAFLTDRSPNAYEKQVDRLLASPRYGERMTVDWLDLARYADSYGYQVDRQRDVWPWRDWVIKAFNEDLPFNQFVTWQLAGDLLPHATDEQVLATAFNRMHQQESEGGSVEEEYRVEYVCDRVQTFATAFLGLTFECSRCHDHKFDPITQKDYYSLFAMFQNVDEAGLYSYFTSSTPTPAMMLLDQPAKDKLGKLRQNLAAMEAAASEMRQAARPAFEEWFSQAPALEIPGELARYNFDVLEPGKKLANAVNPAQPALLRGDNKLVPGHTRQALSFTGDDPVDLPLGNFHSYEPFSISLWLKTPDVKERAVVLHRSKAWTDAGSRGYELLIEEGKLKWSLINFWPGNAASIRASAPLAINEWAHVTITSDGSGKASGLHLYLNGQVAPTQVIEDTLTKDITGGGGDNITLGQRSRDRGFKGGQMDDLRIFGRELTPLEVSNLPADTKVSSPVDNDAWWNYYLAAQNRSWKDHLAELQTARAALIDMTTAARDIMVMKELPQPKKAYVLFRGQYAEHRAEVTMATPAVLPPLPAGAPRNRLGLAEWLTSPQHPLFSRVTVNRFWQELFGRGLVKTAEDFGSQGAKPSYPEVLDWLALRFMDEHWDVKGLFKTIVMSRTYRQRSIADTKTMTDDPDNEWLAHGPRFRLPAEMIRDNALAAAGLLQEQLGGPPINAYEMSEAYKAATPSAGAGVYRRSMYANWRRTSPPPAMIAFDAPRRAICTAHREHTDSPLQALILLNGTQYVEAARVLGESLWKNHPSDVDAMVTEGFLRCLSRKPDVKEQAICHQLFDEQLAWFRSHNKDASTLMKIGRHAHDTTLPLAECAASTVLAQALLNHDACVVNR